MVGLCAVALGLGAGMPVRAQAGYFQLNIQFKKGGIAKASLSDKAFTVADAGFLHTVGWSEVYGYTTLYGTFSSNFIENAYKGEIDKNIDMIKFGPFSPAKNGLDKFKSELKKSIESKSSSTDLDTVEFDFNSYLLDTDIQHENYALIKKVGSRVEISKEDCKKMLETMESTGVLVTIDAEKWSSYVQGLSQDPGLGFKAMASKMKETESKNP